MQSEEWSAAVMNHLASIGAHPRHYISAQILEKHYALHPGDPAAAADSMSEEMIAFLDSVPATLFIH